QARGFDAGYRTELVAERTPNPDRFAGKTNDNRTNLRVSVAFVATHARRGADPVAHAVHAELGPAFAPQICRRARAIDGGKHPGQFLNAGRNAAVRLTHIDRLDLEIAGHGPADVPRLVEIDAEIIADDTADGAAPSDDARNRLLVDRILRRHNEAIGREIRPD